MIRHILLAIGLSLSFLTAWNSASLSRSFNNESSASPVHNQRPSYDDNGRPGTIDRSGYIVASS
jgi:hypothetical protein